MTSIPALWRALTIPLNSAIGSVPAAYFGSGANSVIHSRLGFYQGDIFTEEPEVDRDVIPILETLRRLKPSIVTVALDPEGSGPDTHYKVLQAIASALKLYQQEEPEAQTADGSTTLKFWASGVDPILICH